MVQNVRNLRKSLRAGFHCLLLNPLVTASVDRFAPARSLGVRGELAAERFLLRQGYVIVGRSYSDAIGELDLIAVDEQTIVFVEVKTRSSDAAGVPAEAVDDQKQERITRTALSYLKRHDLLNCSVRFDVIAVNWPSSSAKPAISHFKSAFEAVGNSW